MERIKKDKMLRAAALKYDVQQDAAPRVVAKGVRNIAEKILEAARQNNIPIYEDPDLVELLMKIEVGDEIPDELYQVVAEVLSFVYKASQKWKTFTG